MRAPSRKQALLVAGAVGALVVVGAGSAIATSGDDGGQETPITGSDLERASEAALAETGEGRVTDTEVDDEESWFEVEVTLDDGSQVDVQLDRDFTVVGVEADDESPDGS